MIFDWNCFEIGLKNNLKRESNKNTCIIFFKYFKMFNRIDYKSIHGDLQEFCHL